MTPRRSHRAPAIQVNVIVPPGGRRSNADSAQDDGVRDMKLPHRGCPALARNMFSSERQPIDPAKRFRGTGDLLRTVQEMAPLSQVMCRPGIRGNGVPAGYTYLAQLVAHDMAVLREGTEGGTFDYESKSPEEEFLRPLTLGTLYGLEQPTHSPVSLRDGARDGMVRLYRFPPSALDPEAPPAYDFDRDDTGTPFVHDPRNDDTPILAQTAALFFGYHNFCVGRLRERLSGDDLYQICRQLTVETYQRIVRNDLLQTLLHPDVRRHYDSKGVLIDRGATLSALPAVEFMHGVFRFGHAMVQPLYRLRPGGQLILLTDLLRGVGNLSELRHYDPGFWRVDWRLFYGEEAQLSGALAPSLAPVFAEVPGLRDSEALGIRIDAEHGDWRHDMAMRDLARSADSGLSSVRYLAEDLRPWFLDVQPIAGCVSFDDDRREAAIRAWCDASFPDGMPAELSAFLTTDPPLSFYTLLEASLPVEQGGGAGRHLGTLGSILVAEAVHAALRAAGGAFGSDRRLPDARREVHRDDAPPATMAELIALLATNP